MFGKINLVPVAIKLIYIQIQDYFREQCRKDTLVKTQTCFDFFKICSEKFHNRSESLTEDIFDFQISSKQNFRSANSEPLLMEQNSFSKMDPVMQDSTSDITDFSALDKFDVEFGEYIFNLKCRFVFL